MLVHSTNRLAVEQLFEALAILPIHQDRKVPPSKAYAFRNIAFLDEFLKAFTAHVYIKPLRLSTVSCLAINTEDPLYDKCPHKHFDCRRW